jgi:hypothetical protein
MLPDKRVCANRAVTLGDWQAIARLFAERWLNDRHGLLVMEQRSSKREWQD